MKSVATSRQELNRLSASIPPAPVSGICLKDQLTTDEAVPDPRHELLMQLAVVVPSIKDRVATDIFTIMKLGIMGETGRTTLTCRSLLSGEFSVIGRSVTAELTEKAPLVLEKNPELVQEVIRKALLHAKRMWAAAKSGYAVVF